MEVRGVFLITLAAVPLLILLLLFVFAHIKLILVSKQLVERVGKISLSEHGRMTRPFAGMDISLSQIHRFIRSNALEEYEQVKDLKELYEKHVKQLTILLIAQAIAWPSILLIMFGLVLLFQTFGIEIS